jgi:mannitol-1-/sugar-/sorbitol-6-/2-deoxyglucose-6-phosphatase
LVQSLKPFSKKTREQLMEEITEAMREMIVAKGEALPGVYETLDFFRSRSVPLALASSSDHQLISTVLRKLSLEAYFSVIRSGEHEPFGKPHPQIFISTARDLRVEPADCVVFEDSINGVLAAKAAGMFCIAVPDRHGYEDSRLAIADVKLRSLADFKEELLLRHRMFAPENHG